VAALLTALPFSPRCGLKIKYGLKSQLLIWLKDFALTDAISYCGMIEHQRLTGTKSESNMLI
jgi:hypothetical protein